MSYNFNSHSATLDGVKLRFLNLHIKETAKDTNYFYGVNYELSYYKQRITQSRYNAEARTILGTNQGDWKFTINPIFNVGIKSSPAGRSVGLDLFSQVMRSFGERFALGIEHYSNFGQLSKPTFGPQSDQISYLVTEIKTKHHFDIHLGVGHGWTAGSPDKLVFKALIGLPF
jgi:hypothetical protein